MAKHSALLKPIPRTKGNQSQWSEVSIKKKHREPSAKRPRLESLMIEASDFMEQNSEAKIQQSVKRQEQTKVEPAVDTESVILDPEPPNRKIKIGTGLETVFKQELTHLLREYADVFAWGPEDMPGIDESVAMHSLDVDPRKKPVKQKRRNFAPERQQAIDDEVEKLLKADIICEIKYPDWLANVVLVKKPNGRWRMCVDYTNLNSACPKDSYPLPSIDQLIDATSGHVMLSFMDAFSGYNQIKMNPGDIPKTAFITHRAVYAYKMMSFGLINVGATYQRMMNAVFESQMGRNMESYVDDMISKSKNCPDHIKDLKECFKNLRKNSMKLNPEKVCLWGGPENFWDFMVSNRGIEANPRKIKAILEMKTPRTQKDIQKLAGCLADLRRFIPSWQKNAFPFFDLLKGAKNKKDIDWTPECQQAFEVIRAYLAQPPILYKANPGEPLYLYLSVGPSGCRSSTNPGREHASRNQYTMSARY